MQMGQNHLSTEGLFEASEIAATPIEGGRPSRNTSWDETTSFMVATETEPRPGYRIAKRVIETSISLAVLTLLSPVLLLLLALVRLDSPGPAIYRQDRLHGRRVRRGDGWVWVAEPFTLLKLRTMVADADPRIHREYMSAYLSRDTERLKELNPDRRPGGSFRPAADPRVTRIGAWLRRLSLDEVPQLWNVVRGDMALVGPRPPMPYEAELYEPWDRKRLACPSGVTGWAQIRGRAGIGRDELFALDLEYLEQRSLWVDLKIMVLSVPAVLFMRGAD